MQVNLSNLIAAQAARLTASQPVARVQTPFTQTLVAEPTPDTTAGQPDQAGTTGAQMRIGAKIDIRV